MSVSGTVNAAGVHRHAHFLSDSHSLFAQPLNGRHGHCIPLIRLIVAIPIDRPP